MNLKYKNDSNTNHDFTLIDFYKLLRIYDLKSFTELKSESPKIVDFNFFISQSISHDSDIKLFRELLVIFPYYFFANISITERDSIKNLINGNKKFKNHEELTKLFDFDFDVTTLIESLDELKKHGYQFNYPKIVTDLYITLLEYAFLILCKTIKIKAFNTVFEMVEEFSKTVKISGHIAKDKLF
ncbi:hypothetical protein, partial [Psychroflexus sp. MES1-P1E]|uniref:hypothetical protein n=1 Tax=Psychroflexus sp. MES1-P1E TaxID=2058320 RepID=UPI000CBC8178